MKAFLTAEWRKLAIANYEVDPTLLKKYLPYKTEIDLWHDQCYISLVGFRFENTKVLGIRIPKHSHFEEINLRFYVRYRDHSEWKRGVVFIKEIVPKRAITLVATRLYKESYVTMPTRHTWEAKDNRMHVKYEWHSGQWEAFEIIAENTPQHLAAESKEEFITEHYWGYTRVSDSRTTEYQVTHPRWKVYPVKDYLIQVDFGTLYGQEFAWLSQEKPASVFLAEGSEIGVGFGRRI